MPHLCVSVCLFLVLVMKRWLHVCRDIICRSLSWPEYEFSHFCSLIMRVLMLLLTIFFHAEAGRRKDEQSDEMGRI
ncbi:hypothetical protein B0H66DRAFT_292533 [Apodospora peruviana]|uniref:Uncharacterized protein n=1 Tax=Apodospora peruviana TaxID=516989 RepID=A0AAE0M1Z8_9PEZI|nr:hypothetical protein B0H66DRAFT_292533 [Apodospora peruviana]